MTTFNKSSLQALWVNGFVPQGSDYSDLIASQVNIAETALQSMAGPLQATELVAPQVSATNVNVTGTLAVPTINATGALSINATGNINVSAASSVILNNLRVTTDVSATSGAVYTSALNTGMIRAAATFTVSAASNITQKAGGTMNLESAGAFTVSATGQFNATGSLINLNSPNSNVTVSAGGNIALRSVPVIISAAGTALATATPITATINRIQGVTDGQTTGVKLQSGQRGLALQYVINETATSANLWPFGSDYKINALASGAAFSMAASTMYTVVYSTASAYWVK